MEALDCYINMIDKGKYSSHGAFIKRLPAQALAQRLKPKLALIHPLPSSQPRVPAQDHQLQGVTLQSSTLSTKFRFQSNIDRKPVGQELVQPFLYIEKIIRKAKTKKTSKSVKKQEPEKELLQQNKTEENKDSKKVIRKRGENQPKLQPFITSVNMKARKTKNPRPESGPLEAPLGFANLYEYQEEKRVIAEKVFSKLMENDVHSLKDMFLMWSGKAKKVNPDIDIKEKEFVDFIKEILPGKIAQKQVRRFFELYMHRPPKGKENDDHFRNLSIKAFSFNYEKWKKNQMEVSNILSQKSLKERYLWVKNYLVDFDNNYHELKEAMESIKGYEESLKTHFKQLYQSYQNPYQQQIDLLEQELQKPIIKYDKMKKAQLTRKVETLSNKNQEIHGKLTSDFQHFLDNYEAAVLTNHDLFFTKRTICKLVLPILHQHPTLTHRMIQQQVELEQNKKEEYLQCLSEIVVELDKDKKHLGEDCFTLDEVVQLVLMKNKKGTPRFSQQFLLYSSKKLIKEVKKQFLLKHQLSVQSIDEFPADQQIDINLLHTCFEMECTKVLFKNQIWTELLNFIPIETPQKSNLHQNTIDANYCLELLRRYLLKLDEKMKIELNKSKQISLLAENVTLEQFAMFGKVFQGVLNQIDTYVEDDEEQHDKVEPLEVKPKLSFGDLAEKMIDRNNFPQKAKEEDEQKERENNLVKTLIKSIFQEQLKEEKEKAEEPQIHIESFLGNIGGKDQLMPPSPQNIADMNSLAKSFFVPEGLNTNSFDIRYYQKEKAKVNMNSQVLEPDVIRMGSSILLANLPKVEEITSSDPLKISRLLMTNIDKGLQEEKKVIRQQMIESSIREGVSNHYFNNKIKLENKPTIYDSEGKSKYSVLLPVGYYEDFVAAENIPEAEKWYLRPHHVETLTENPLSKKDNMIHTEYQSKLEKLPLKKRPDQYIIEENVKRKSQLIGSLEERIGSLKKDLEVAQRGSRIKEGVTVPPNVVDSYYSKLVQEKEDKDLEIAGYEGVLYDLRRKERELLNGYRDRESAVLGEPDEKWWQRKDKNFNIELRKQRLLVADELSGQYKHREYVDKLKNSQIY